MSVYQFLILAGSVLKEPQYMDTCWGVSALGSKINILNEKADFLLLAKFEFEPNIRKYNQ